jgi:hypothetical protein
MTIRSTTLIPGLLVGLSTSIRSNVKHNKTETRETTNDDGSVIAEWETERTTIDPKEHEAAVLVRSQARGCISKVCSWTAFGYLCPESKFEALNKAIAEGRKLCEDFNASAAVTRIGFFVLTGRIASDDVGAVRAINGEIRSLLADMAEGISKLDVEVVRKSAIALKQVGSMLPDDAKAIVKEAIDAARKQATKIVAAGEQAATEIDKTVLAKLAEARTAFLDIDEGAVIQDPTDKSGRAIDLAPHEAVTAPVVPVREIELETSADALM